MITFYNKSTCIDGEDMNTKIYGLTFGYDLEKNIYRFIFNSFDGAIAVRNIMVITFCEM